MGCLDISSEDSLKPRLAPMPQSKVSSMLVVVVPIMSAEHSSCRISESLARQKKLPGRMRSKDSSSDYSAVTVAVGI